MLGFVAWQVAIVVGSIVAYFGVRGLTEGDPANAHRNASRVLDLEHALRIDVEQQIHAVPGAQDSDKSEDDLLLDTISPAHRLPVQRRKRFRIRAVGQDDDVLLGDLESAY